MESNGSVCPKCHGARRIQQEDGTIHPCWDCLTNGEMNQHSKNPKDSGIKI